MGLRTAFTRHPAAVGQTYFEHLASASRFAGTMIVAGVACLVHAAFPMIFVRTASEAVDQLQQRMAAGRRRGESPTGLGAPRSGD